MFFSECKVKSGRGHGRTITQIAPLEQFDNHKTDHQNDDFVVNGVCVRLRGTVDNYAVYFNGDKVGDRVYGNTENLDVQLYQHMVNYFHGHNIRF